MKIKNIITQLVFIFCAFSASSQSINYALNFSGNSKVDCYAMTELNNLANYSVQCLVNPTQSLKNAYIFHRGEGESEFSLKFDATGKLLLTTGLQNITIAESLPANTWSQISIVALSSGIDVWINGSLSHKPASTGAIIPTSASSFVIGEQFLGRIDEFRFWNCPILESEQENLMFSNTVNKFHPKYDNLLFYYKFDQDQCENIVDYKLKHHATPINATRVKVTDNEAFKYRVVSGYSSLVRHSDRLQINRDMHLMTNDLIFLDAQVISSTGAVKMSYPHSQGVLANAEFEETYDSHQGVIHFKGTGAGMNVGDGLFQTYGLAPYNKVTFESWINIEQWVEGASLLYSKSEATGKQIIIKLGAEAQKEIIVLIDDYEYRFNNAVKATGWEHFAICLDPLNSKTNGKIKAFCDATQIPIATAVKGTTFTVYNLEGESIIGKDFKGHMDAIMIWGADRTGNLLTDAVETSSDIKFPGGGYNAIFLLSYWKCDDSNNPGKNSRSWVSMINDIRNNEYKDHRGYKMRVGLISNDGKWMDNIARQDWRDRLVKDVSEDLLPYCDGVDVDFEWIYSGDSRWNTGYGPMVEQLRAVIDKETKAFSVSLHGVSYFLPLKYINMPDYYTFQLYGPAKTYYLYEKYVEAYDTFIKWGFPNEKIGLSYPTLATTGKAVTGYMNVIAANPDIDPSANEANINGILHTFNGVNCVKDKMKFILDKNSGTVMYFDMGNDVSVDKDLSLIRAAHSVISANVDSLIVDAKPSGVSLIKVNGSKDAFTRISYNSNSGDITINAIEDVEIQQVSIIATNGATIKSEKTNGKQYIMRTESMPAGIYIARIETTGGTDVSKIIIKNIH